MNKNHITALLCILFLAFFIRLYDLNTESLWLDEGASLSAASLASAAEIVEHAKMKDVHPPTYYFLLHYWVKLFGNSEFSLRFPSLVFGVLSILAMYFVGALLFDSKTALLGSLFLASSVFHLYYSQEARMYSLMTFLTLASFYFFIKMIMRQGRYNSLGYVFFSALLIYTHVYGFFTVLAQNIYFFCFRPKKCTILKWIVIQASLIILFLPWLNIFLFQRAFQAHPGHPFQIPFPSMRTLIDSVIRFASFDITLWLLLFFAGFAFFALFTKAGDGSVMKDREKAVFLLIWLLSPIVIPLIISVLISPIFLIYLTIGALPAFYLLAAKGISCIRQKMLRIFILLLVLALSTFSLYAYYERIDKEQWREASTYIGMKADKNDVIIFHPEYIRPLFVYYQPGVDLPLEAFPKELPFINETNINDLSILAYNYRRVWLVERISDSKISDPNELIIKKLNQSFSLVDKEEFVNIRVLLYQNGSFEGNLG